MINRSPLDAGTFEPTFLSLVAGNSDSNTAYFDNVKLYTTTTDPDPDKIYTYTYNAPSAITKNSVTAAVSYDKDSPQPEGASITATVTLSGTATAAGTHTVGLASAADITGGVAAPSTVTKTVTANQVMTASDTFAFTFTMPAANVDDLVLTHIFDEALTGTVDITGTEKYGSELTATVTGSNNTGTLTYQWKRGTTDIGTNSNNYTLVEADIGQTITCEVTSSVQNGMISDTTGIIGKADTDVPVAPTLSAKTHNSITVTANTLHEFRLGTDGSWQTSNVFSGLAADTAYTIYVRVAETATNAASPASSTGLAVTTDSAPVDALAGTITITGTQKYDQILTADTTGITNNTGVLSYRWKRGTTDIGTNSNSYALVEADIGQTITCEVTSSVETGTISDTTGAIGKGDTDAPDAPALSGKTHNSITVAANALHEFRLGTDGSWQTSNVFSGLAADTAYTIYARVAETATNAASPASSTGLAVTTDSAPVDALAGTITITGTQKYDQILTADTTGITNNTGVLSYRWKRGTTDIGTNSDSYALVEADIGQTITCEVTSSVETGTISDTTGAIGKADGPIPPAGLVGVKPDAAGANGSITGTTSAMEYSMSTDFSTAADCAATETAVAPGIYYVRMKATATTEAGANAIVTVPNADTPVYTVTFNANGGTCATASAVTDTDGKLTTLPTPSWTGHTFNGWYTAAAGGEKITVDKVYTSNTTIYAQWTKDSSGGSPSGGSSSYVTVYDMIEGANVTWTSDATTGLSFVCNGFFYKFLHIKVDGSIVSASNYADVSGSTIVTLEPEYLKTLSGGIHTLRFEYTDGYANTSFVVSESDPTNPQTGADLDFTDVSETDWFYDDVVYMFEQGLMNGTSSTTFSPNLVTTRGMVVAILYRMENSPAVSGDEPFGDVKPDSYYWNAITWAAANGIVNGYGNRKFGPDDSITREQMAAILYRYAKYKEYNVTKSADLAGFADADGISGYALVPMQWTNAEGLIRGITATILAPVGDATRSQVAAIIHRFCINIKK